MFKMLMFFLTIISSQMTDTEITDLLQKINERDRLDRFFLFDTSNTSKNMIINDSLNLKIVRELDKNRLLNLPIQKYYAAFIYYHGGGKNEKQKNYERSLELLKEILELEDEPKFIDSIRKKDITSVNDVILKKILDDKNQAKIKIIEMKSNESDTIYILEIYIKEMAKSLKRLCENRLNPTNSLPKVNLNKMDDEEYINILKSELKEKIKSQVGNLMSDKEIDIIVEKELEKIKNIQNTFIKDIKENPEKFGVDTLQKK